MEQKNFTDIISNIDRFEIPDLHEELVICKTSKTRIPEIERLFNKALGEGAYYNICYNNPAYEFIIDSVVYFRHVPEDMRHICDMSLKKCFRFYTSTTNHFLRAYVIKSSVLTQTLIASVLVVQPFICSFIVSFSAATVATNS